MRWLLKLVLRVRSLVFQRRMDEELRGELQFHLEQLTRENIDIGMRPEEARRSAERSLGGVAQLEEACRDERRVGPLIDVWRDLRYGWRTLGRTPLLAGTIVLTLGLGIGANAAIFRIADVLLFRNLPVAEPQRLFQPLQPDGPGLRAYGELFTMPDFQTIRDDAAPYATLAASGTVRPAAVIVDGGTEESISCSAVSGNYFQVLGVAAGLGRTFAAADERGEAATPVAVLSDSYWRRRFQGAPDVLGRVLRIEGHPYQILGVAKAGFIGIDVESPADVWTTLPTDRAATAPMVRLIGRLHDGATVEQTAAPIQASHHRRMAEMAQHAPPGTPRALIDHILALRIRVAPAANGLSVWRTSYRTPVLIVFGLVALILLAACATVATLLEARRNVRQTELAVRRSLGASRWRMLRQLLCEAGLLASAAAVAGWVLALWLAPVMVRWLGPVGGTVSLPPVVDGRAMWFTAAVSVATLFLFGLVPAWRASDVDLAPALKAGAGQTGRTRGRSARAWVACQAALSLVLVMGATMFARTLWNLSHIDPGVARSGVVVAQLRYRGPDRGARLAAGWAALRQGVAEQPGMEAVSLSSGSAFAGAAGNGILRLPGRAAGPENGCVFFQVSADFFSASGIELLRGRDFAAPDFEPGAAPVAVLAESAARRLFPGGDAVGQVFSNLEDRPPRWVQVIGVVRDTRFQSLRTAPARAVYLPYTWPRTPAALALVVRTRLDTGTLAARLRKAAQDSGFVVRQMTSQSELIDRTLVRERQLALVSSGFGALALLLAAVGLFGMVHYTNAQRTREFGIRMALGAGPGAVAALVLRESAGVLAVGATVGLLVGQALGRLTESLLFGVAAYDAGTLVPSMAALAMVSLGAAALPAWRAGRMNPVAALRQE